MAISEATANRKRRAEILKQRRRDGKVKQVMSSTLRNKRAAGAKLKADKLAQRERAQREKGEMRAEIKAQKKEIREERMRNAKLERELRSANAREARQKRETGKKDACTDTNLMAIRQAMMAAVPTALEMRGLTSAAFSRRRETMSSTWTSLRKFLVACHKKHFESVKKKKVAKAPRNPSKGSGAPVFKNRAVFLPDIGQVIDEAAYKKATAAAFGQGNVRAPGIPKKRGKSPRIAPIFLGTNV
ncbi:unnamed protein product [Ectocarpus sp. 6 AP-2014]